MASPTRWMWVWVPLGDGDRQGGLRCCDLWGRKESVTTEQLKWTELNGTLRLQVRKCNNVFLILALPFKLAVWNNSSVQIFKVPFHCTFQVSHIFCSEYLGQTKAGFLFKRKNLPQSMLALIQKIHELLDVLALFKKNMKRCSHFWRLLA